MFRRHKGENKAKLEHKLYLARENPEPTFDLSDCELSTVPQGIYSLCRVFLKDELHLENNRLCSLAGGGNLKDLQRLKVLDVSHNAFRALPDDICLLLGLRELLVNHNQLKTLPLTINKLTNLEILNVSDNCLKNLPEAFEQLQKLKYLNIRSNKAVKSLPRTLCHARKLSCLEVDSNSLDYPPKKVTDLGTEAVRKFLCDDNGISYIPPEELVESEEVVEDKTDSSEVDKFEAKIWELERIKQQKIQDFLNIEKHNEMLQKQEVEMAQAQKMNRQKLLETIADEQKRFDSALNKIHLVKETERFKLIEQLQEAENNADIAIKQLLTLNQEPLEQLLEQERQEEERLLNAVNRYSDTLRKEDILSAMQDILRQETERFQKFDRDRVEASKTILEQEMETDGLLSMVLRNQDVHKAELIVKLQEDSDLQKVAVGTLLERGDARSWGLLQQVRLVESQLAALTQIEIERKSLQMDQHLNDLSEKRVSLSILLIDLMDQQKERRKQLLSTLKTLEDCNEESAEDFWLKQYQRLLDKLPEGLSEAQKNIDSRLAQALLVNGVIHCLPFLAKLTQCCCDMNSLTEDDLKEAGVGSARDREGILCGFKLYKKERGFNEPDYQPSAPVMVEAEASAPLPEQFRSINSMECVICLDEESQIIFVPCGHLCCCGKCSGPVAECPLCRSTIERKISAVV